MRLTYDATTDVACLELRELDPGEVLGPNLLLEPDRALRALVIADFTGRDGMLVGFEMVGASRCLTTEVLAGAERIDGGNLAERMLARMAGHGLGEEGGEHVH